MTKVKTITPAQLRAARGMINLGYMHLAARARIGKTALARFENGHDDLPVDVMHRIMSVLEKAGVEFIPGGVRMKEVNLRKIKKAEQEANLREIKKAEQEVKRAQDKLAKLKKL